MISWFLIIVISGCIVLAVDNANDVTELDHDNENIEWEDSDTGSVSINANEVFADENNDTIIIDTPQLSVQVNFGEPEDEFKIEARVEENKDVEGLDGVSNINLPLDPFTLHRPFIQPPVTEFEYSDWYLLFLSPVLKLSSRFDFSSASSEVSALLSSKLSVPSSMFSINSLDEYKSHSISANLSLMSHSIPKLHHNLCNLQNKSPIFWIRGIQFRLVKVLHDKNQHIYINNKQVTFLKHIGNILSSSTQLQKRDDAFKNVDERLYCKT